MADLKEFRIKHKIADRIQLKEDLTECTYEQRKYIADKYKPYNNIGLSLSFVIDEMMTNRIDDAVKEVENFISQNKKK